MTLHALRAGWPEIPLAFGQLQAEHAVSRADLDGCIAMLGSELAAKMLGRAGLGDAS